MVKKLFVGDYAFGIAAAFVAGILAASLGWNSFLAIAAVGMGLASVHFWKKIFLWREIGVFLAVLYCGALYYHLYLAWDAAALTLPFGKLVSISGVVMDEPKESAKYEVFDLSPPHSHSITILAAPTSGYQYGDLLQVRGFLYAPDSSGTNPLMASPKITILASNRGFWLRERLIGVKHAIFQKFNEILPRDEAGLLGGVAFGGTSGISAELKGEMERSGTSYILSMYGYKIAAVVAVTGEALKTFFSRRTVFLLSLVLLILFVLMAGLEASAIRAGIMVSLALVAKQLGRRYEMKNALVLTAAIMLAFDPVLLLSDAGFQLSILGLLGIAYLEKPIKYFWRYKDAGILAWRDGTVTTLAVLIPMVPPIANMGGQFPLTGIASNVLIFFATPLTVLFGFLIAALSFTFYYLAFFSAHIGAVVLYYDLFIIRIFSIVVIPLPLPFNYSITIVLYYALVAIFAFYYYESE